MNTDTGTLYGMMINTGARLPLLFLLQCNIALLLYVLLVPLKQHYKNCSWQHCCGYWTV